MKKLFKLFSGLLILSAMILTGCTTNANPSGKPASTVTKIDGATVSDEYSPFISLDLSSYSGKTIKAEVSVKMKVENSGDTDPANLMWQINTGDSKYPVIASKSFEKSDTDWSTVTGNNSGNTIVIADGAYFYLSTYQLTAADFIIYLDDFLLTITVDDEETYYGINSSGEIVKKDSRLWSDVKSLKTVYVDSGLFDHFGFATTMAEITGKSNHKDKAALMAKHGNTTSMGNEMKPQWILWNYGTKISTNGTFKASNGKTIDIPVLPASSDTEHGLGGVATALQIAKDKGIQMRGHVLTWHSQTFDWFFCKDYDVSKGLVDKDTMTARHEWYIKTVLEYVADWEAKNNDGKHIIYTWDVVNEAVADDALGDTYLRGSTTGTSTDIPALASGCHSEGGTSRWYQIYESDEFIINAFRFANKYAPADVTLCYNDYNEYYEWTGHTTKRSGIIKVLNAVLAHKNDSTLPTRLDAFGMQSHLEDWVSLSSVESAIEEFLKLGIDLQVTELDFAWNTDKYTDAKSKGYSGTGLENLYADHMKLYIKYAKSKRTSQKNGITSVTLWAVEDNDNWLNKNGIVYYPSIFERDKNDKLVAKDAFFAVLNAAK